MNEQNPAILLSTATAYRIQEMPKFFVGGSAKSGTTWLQLLLDGHPEVSCFGEAHLFDVLVPSLAATLEGYNRDVDWKNTAVFAQLPGCPLIGDEQAAVIVRMAFSTLAAQRVGEKLVKIIGEKTPDNTGYLPLLQHIFPEAKVLQMVRDGRDCAVSGWFHNMRISEQSNRERFPSMASYARSFATSWAAELQCGEDFRAQHPDGYLAARYEDLTASPVQTLCDVLRFLGVDASEAVAESCLNAASFEKMSGGRPRGNEDPSSFFRKGVVGDWRNHLDTAAADDFATIAGKWLARYRYRLD
jgi:hypothetical protein